MYKFQTSGVLSRSLEGHTELESDAADPGLQSTLVGFEKPVAKLPNGDLCQHTRRDK